MLHPPGASLWGAASLRWGTLLVACAAQEFFKITTASENNVWEVDFMYLNEEPGAAGSIFHRPSELIGSPAMALRCCDSHMCEHVASRWACGRGSQDSSFWDVAFFEAKSVGQIW